MGEEKEVQEIVTNENKAKRKRWPIVVGIIAVVILILVAVAAYVFNHYYSLLDRQIGTETEDWVPITLEEDYEADLGEGEDAGPEATAEEIAALEEQLEKNLETIQETSVLDVNAFNILLIGVDSRGSNFSGRSDSMILVSINKETKKIVMTSFLRDIYVSIPGHGSNRLNAAYAYGGTSLLAKTIKSNFGISVDRCVVVNFYLVMDFVDALGGLDINISSDEIRVMNDYVKGHNILLGKKEGSDIISQSDAGMVHLNGSQTLAYSRVRYVGTDFARTERQRNVLSLCQAKAMKMNLTEMNSLLEEFLPRVRTDLTASDCASLLLLALSMSDYEVSNMTIPQDGTWSNARINGMAVLNVDFAANAKAWYEKVSEK